MWASCLVVPLLQLLMEFDFLLQASCLPVSKLGLRIVEVGGVSYGLSPPKLRGTTGLAHSHAAVA
jgi:hypothetical protein